MIPSNRNNMLIWIESRLSWGGIVNCDCWQVSVKKLSKVGIVLEKCFWKGTDLNRREADVSLKLHHLSLKTLRSPPGDIYWILLRRKYEFRYWSNTKEGFSFCENLQGQNLLKSRFGAISTFGLLLASWWSAKVEDWN